MRTHRAGRWLVGVFVLAAVAFGLAGIGTEHRTTSDWEWQAPVGQFVAR